MKNKTKFFIKIISIFSCIIFLAVAFFWHFYWENNEIIEINGQKFRVELAKTIQEQSQGLGGRENLAQNEGMLFEFGKYGEYVFWMKDMKFNLDIIWIADDKIVHLEKNIPCDSLKKIDPKIIANKVLEINAGISDKYNFKIGDRVIIY
ncbi:MAG: hypothetical protein A2271_03270 [Candidatus Moranbacteria bacterium RIFOXYA12_FULL_35_19]|nr:MAG: hypothetical protein UR78_C0010G0010 [Candidatus Moranbacteria bacterium GW2011_GWF2_35_39]OGI32335.1 MAG: hypothetical protein A2489_03275 [Candidatus Moranbacteria bacterium RIFOXYC12_FULL_36_13]OGI36595.1 MAG: hypothetical protein A2271_03270 [Candidatus Moranbacteria bacterium RIFOXYA12_FULL_35_19]